MAAPWTHQPALVPVKHRPPPMSETPVNVRRHAIVTKLLNSVCLVKAYLCRKVGEYRRLKILPPPPKKTPEINQAPEKAFHY